MAQESTLVHIKNYLEKAAPSLDTHHPGWRGGNLDNDTICIPDGLDLFKNYLGQIPEGKIEEFTKAEFNEAIDAGKKTYGGFNLNKLPKGFDPTCYEQELIEVKQYWAEQRTLDRVRQFGIDQRFGGYLLLDVNSQQLIKTLLVSDTGLGPNLMESKKVLQECKAEGFQIDILLMHPKHGIVIFEVKFGEPDMKQLRTHGQNLENFMKKSFGGNQQLPPVTLVKCCPNRPIGKDVPFTTGRKKKIHKVGFDHYITQDAFNDRMHDILPSQATNDVDNWFADPVFQQLFTLLAAHRSDTFTCRAASSLELHRKIAIMEAAKHLNGYGEVNAFSLGVDPFHPSGGGEAAFLSPEQLNIVEHPVKHQIIWGAPGSGKTLLVMISVLEWCREERREGNGPDKVIVYVGSRQLALKYDRFFKACQQRGSLKRTPLIRSGSAYFRQYICRERGIKFRRQPVEVGVGDGQISTLIGQHNNRNDVALDEGHCINRWELADLFDDKIVGRRLLALTGYIFAESIFSQSSASNLVGIIEPEPLVKITQLRTIFRGTTTIINEWKRYLEESYGDELTIAHNFAGLPVTWMEAITPEQVCAMVEQCINDAKCGASCLSTETDTKTRTNLSDIAVIYDPSVYTSTILKAALERRGIRCQSIVESVEHPDSGAVVFDDYFNSLSYEWNTVIAVGKPSPFKLIAASRAIAKLCIIEFDYDAYEKELTDEYDQMYAGEPVDMGQVTEGIRRMGKR